MNSIIFLTIFKIFMMIHTSFGQVLSCSYGMDGNIYTCGLTIQNPNGLNNFTVINGTHLPGKNNNDVRSIVRSSGSTTNIPSIICDTFQHATTIDLESCGIQTVNEYSFNNCKNLSHLDLFRNKITTIDEKSFSENLELEFLELSNNLLKTLPENVFVNQHNLISLYLYGNQVTELPEYIFNSLESLERLDIGINYIQNIKVKWFKNLQKLRFLSLDQNNIEELPTNVFNSLKNIETMDLYENKLKVIHSDAFGILPNLIIFFAFDNKIDAIDERFIDNTGVQQLYVRNNSCVNVDIFDNSTSRQSMRNTLQTCFDNYKAFYPETTTITSSSIEEQTTTEDPATTSQTSSPGCIDGNLDERVCRLEDKNEDIDQKIENLQKNFNEALEELQNQILILSTRPCSCH